MPQIRLAQPLQVKGQQMHRDITDQITFVSSSKDADAMADAMHRQLSGSIRQRREPAPPEIINEAQQIIDEARQIEAQAASLDYMPLYLNHPLRQAGMATSAAARAAIMHVHDAMTPEFPDIAHFIPRRLEKARQAIMRAREGLETAQSTNPDYTPVLRRDGQRPAPIYSVFDRHTDTPETGQQTADPAQALAIARAMQDQDWSNNGISISTHEHGAVTDTNWTNKSTATHFAKQHRL